MSMCRVLCCWKRVFVMTSAFSWQNSISLCPASFCAPRPNLPVTPSISWLSTFAFQCPIMKRTSFLGVGSKRCGATTCLRSEVMAKRSYPMPEMRGCGQEEQPHVPGAAAARAQEGWEELLHVQGKRNPSKTVGVVRGHQRADTLKP